MRLTVLNKIPGFKLMAAAIGVVLLTVFTIIASCTIVPQERMFVTGNSSMDVYRDNGNCEQRVERKSDLSLSPDNISILNWNIYKGSRDDWKNDLTRLLGQKDILLLQEAPLTDELLEILKENRMRWNFNGTFTFNGQETGVLSASQVAPIESCGFRVAEPILRLPKAATISKYRIKDSDQTLLVGNIHGINFTLGQAAYKNQMTTMAEVLKDHDGPVILAGDFNNWSQKRIETVKELAATIDLKPLEFRNENRTKILGHSVDHIYYRGVEPVELESHPIDSSDHNPLTVTFKLTRLQTGALTAN